MSNHKFCVMDGKVGFKILWSKDNAVSVLVSSISKFGQETCTKVGIGPICIVFSKSTA